MHNATTVLTWAGRALGLSMACFLGVFALDAFDGRTGWAAIQAFLVHLLPAAVVLAAAMIGWRWPVAGAGLFAAAAAAYAAVAWTHPDWVLIIAGPMAVTAVVFWLSARRPRVL